MVALTDFVFRLELAAGSTPRTASPSWTDITAYALATTPWALSRGRSNEQDAQAQPGRGSASLLNTDGRFTMGNTGSPYAPLQLRRPCRYRVRYGTAAGNLLSAEDASFEGGTVGTWAGNPIGYVASTVANSAVRAQSGTKSLMVTWPTAGATLSAAYANLSGLVIGRTYTLSAYVWVTAATPAVLIGDIFGVFTLTAPTGFSMTSSTTGAWERIAAKFTAGASSGNIGFKNATASTPGQQCWVDAIQLDEGSVPVTFTTTAPPIYDLWSGFVDDWGNGREQLTGVTRVSLSDRLARAAKVKLPAALASEILYDAPTFLYPLDDSETSTTAGDATANYTSTLTSTQLGTGGTLTFGAGVAPAPVTAPGPDEGRVAVFARVDATNGRYFTTTGTVNMNGGITGFTVAAMLCPSSAAVAMSAIRAWFGSQTFAQDCTRSSQSSGHDRWRRKIER